MFGCGANDFGTVPVDGAAKGDTIYELKRIRLPNDEIAAQIATGASFSAALTPEGAVYAWGYVRVIGHTIIVVEISCNHFKRKSIFITFN